MDRSIVMSALAVGCAGWLCGLLMARTKPVLPFAVLVVLAAVAAATLPALRLLAAPATQAWGRGLAAGGLAALLAGLAVQPSADPSDKRRAAAGAAAMASAAVAVVAATMLWMGPALLDALVGIATGWLAVSLVLRAGEWTTAFGTGFVTTLAATVALGHFREAAAAQTTPWMASALAIGALVPILLLATAAVARRVVRTAAVVALVVAVMAGAAAFVGTRTLHDPRFLTAAGIGLVLSLMLWWLLAEGERDLPLHGALPALVALGSGIAAFYALAGYGIGIMLIAGWLPAGLLMGWGLLSSAPRASGDRLIPLWLFGVLLLLYRLLTQRFQDDLGAAALTDHFAIFATLVGAILPSLLGGFLDGSSSEGAEPAAARLVRLALALTGAAAFGATLLVLWGAKAALGLLGGLMLGVVISGAGVPGALLALAVALPLMQWSHALLLISAQTRAEKVPVLIWLVAITGVIIVAAGAW